MSGRLVRLGGSPVDTLAMRPDWEQRLSNAVVVLAMVLAFIIAFVLDRIER